VIGRDRATDPRHARGVGDRQRALGVQPNLQLEGKLPGYVCFEDLLVADGDLRGFAS